MIKFPSASAGGMVPSGNSVAVTYPGVCGSRVGGVGRAGRLVVDWASKFNVTQSNATPHVIWAIFIFSLFRVEMVNFAAFGGTSVLASRRRCTLTRQGRLVSGLAPPIYSYFQI